MTTRRMIPVSGLQTNADNGRGWRAGQVSEQDRLSNHMIPKALAIVAATIYGSAIAILIAAVLHLPAKLLIPELDPYPPTTLGWKVIILVGIWAIAIALGFREGVKSYRRKLPRD